MSRKKYDNFVLRNKEGMYLSNRYILTSNINHALVFVGKANALWKADWLKSRMPNLEPIKIKIAVE